MEIIKMDLFASTGIIVYEPLQKLEICVSPKEKILANVWQ